MHCAINLLKGDGDRGSIACKVTDCCGMTNASLIGVVDIEHKDTAGAIPGY
jgi:hypothetical protein